MDDEINRWTARRKSALVLEIIQGKTTVAEASRAHDLPPSEIEKWLDDGKRGMENALRANPQDLREQHEKQLKYRLWVHPRTRSIRDRLAPFFVALLLGVLVNSWLVFSTLW